MTWAARTRCMACDKPPVRMRRCEEHARELIDRIAPLRNAADLERRRRNHPGVHHKRKGGE